MKKISWIPAYTEKAASTRIRVLSPHNAINKFYSDKFESFLGYQPNSDVLIVQKEITPENLNYVQNFKGLKIYDFDDPMSHRWGFHEMISSVDIVTTDTVGRKEDFEKLGYKTPCIVIDDCLDYNIYEILSIHESINNNISWFGNHPNINSVMWMFEPILDNNYNINIISDVEYMSSDHHPNISLIKWDTSNFIENIQKSNICVLSHRGEGKNIKSNNKMLVAIACGLPCIVSDSTSYKELSEQFNLDKFVINNNENLLEAIKHLNEPINRKEYLSNIQPYVIDRYISKNVTKQLLNLIK
jgi:glycosyltransferase involved in cell wall biosynthesis